MYKCKCNEATRTLTMDKDKAREEKAKVFKITPWFRDEFRLLGKEQGRKNMAPEALRKNFSFTICFHNYRGLVSTHFSYHPKAVFLCICKFLAAHNVECIY
jgi:hypothetical protein